MMTRIPALATVGLLAASVAASSATLVKRSKTASVAVTIRVLPTASIEFPEGFDFFLVVRDSHDHGRGHDHGRDDGHGHHGKDGHSDSKGGKDNKSSGSKKSGSGKNSHDHDRTVYVDPVLIPFKIKGNAKASVSVKPDEFMRVYRGPYLGAARGPYGYPHHGHSHGYSHSYNSGYPPRGNDKLGYNVVVKFPLASWTTIPLIGWLGYGPGVSPGIAVLPGLNGAGTPPLATDLRGRRYGAYGMIFILSKPDWTIDGRLADEGHYGGRVQVTVTTSD